MKALILILSFIVCTGLYAQKEKFFVFNWRSNGSEELKIPSDKYQSFGKSKLLCYFSNDKDNIYIDMKIVESVELNKILQMGLTVWIDMDEKTRKEMGLRFPIGSRFSRDQNRRGNENLTDIIMAEKKSPLAFANEIEIIGFKGEETRRLPSDNSDSFRGYVKYDIEGDLLYNLIIPIVKLPLRNSGKSNEPMPFNLGIEYGAAPVFNQPGGNMGQRGGSSGRSGGGGGRSGGGGGGMGGGRSGNVAGESPFGAPVLIWIKNVKLAASEQK
jgi:uncharacterized membrane protein YgcG